MIDEIMMIGIIEIEIIITKVINKIKMVEEEDVVVVVEDIIKMEIVKNDEIEVNVDNEDSVNNEVNEVKDNVDNEEIDKEEIEIMTVIEDKETRIAMYKILQKSNHRLLNKI